MSPGEHDIAKEVLATGFPAETLEKVFRLMDLLDALFAHPFLKQRIALKGGTALNLFFLQVPRLSVDIDLNYIGAADREVMLAERPKVEQAIRAVCVREDLAVKHVPSGHAGGKWRLTYRSTTGGTGSLELDINYLLRTPLWPAAMACGNAVGSFRASEALVLDPHELVAGKLAALVARGASRDLFDAREVLARSDLDHERLRLGFVVYGGINRKDWRAVSLDDIRGDPEDVKRSLISTLRADAAPSEKDLAAWVEQLVSVCRSRMSVLLPFRKNESEFLSRLNEKGEIFPELLTDDGRLREVIRAHPGLHWKALNVREHRDTSKSIPGSD